MKRMLMLLGMFVLFSAFSLQWDPVTKYTDNTVIGSEAQGVFYNVERDSSESPPVRHMIKGPPAVASISASPASVLRGACATLTWNTTNAFTASINQGIGNVALSGNRQVCPTVSTPYTITATNPGGSAASVASVSVTVPTQPGCNAPGTLTIMD